jgi:GNAT superfamily N-acetyltransferase
MTATIALPRIAALGAADAPAYRALRLAGLAEAPEAFGASHAEEAARPPDYFAARLSQPPPNRIFGAFDADALVGTAGFVMMSAQEKSRHKGLLVGMHVTPAERGKGVGAALLEAVIAHARGHVVILQAHVGAQNRPAYRLYERLGFRPFGLEPKALLVDGVYVDEALMALDFSEENRES